MLSLFRSIALTKLLMTLKPSTRTLKHMLPLDEVPQQRYYKRRKVREQQELDSFCPFKFTYEDVTEVFEEL